MKRDRWIEIGLTFWVSIRSENELHICNTFRYSILARYMQLITHYDLYDFGSCFSFVFPFIVFSLYITVLCNLANVLARHTLCVQYLRASASASVCLCVSVCVFFLVYVVPCYVYNSIWWGPKLNLYMHLSQRQFSREFFYFFVSLSLQAWCSPNANPI